MAENREPTLRELLEGIQQVSQQGGGRIDGLVKDVQHVRTDIDFLNQRVEAISELVCCCNSRMSTGGPPQTAMRSTIEVSALSRRVDDLQQDYNTLVRFVLRSSS